jgi:hypothetical protein
MEACLPVFDLRLRRAIPLAALALLAGACSGRTIVAVDPYPCEDAGVNGCSPGLLNDLVGYWHLDDAPGSTRARDQSGQGNDGLLAGLDPGVAWVPEGPAGGALSPQGKGYVNVAPSASIDSITNQVTVAAFVYLDGTINDHATAISRQMEAGWGQLYHLSLDAEQKPALFITNPQTLVYLLSPSPVPQQTWLHLAGTWDGEQARLYVDGTEVANAPISGPYGAETNPVILSGNGNGPGKGVSECMPGRLDEVMLYRRALAPADIKKLASGALLPSGGTRTDGGGQ